MVRPIIGGSYFNHLRGGLTEPGWYSSMAARQKLRDPKETPRSAPWTLLLHHNWSQAPRRM
ncbi:hypothetical protein CO2235_150116 [Cupriavidus oxalaticus]|uniref:Uncharacterized protein n=1 Tax=Cupriavidus oxalaticus TaxID=96344 RepID=A0A375FLI5_9BURK|nr:hypothetical protein CO2235_U600002 [Cupriavidus oxalaticus]SPC12461.1 hypothetical protein CO2235_150116 [Cupriavidus oxalaticus]